MAAELIDQIDYRQGYIENRVEVEPPETVTDYEIVESGLLGWGSATHVVLVQGQHYLAKVD